MGVVNCTPDSFSDGGRYLDPCQAIAHGRSLVLEGADLVDVGGESTRPGAAPVYADTEMARILPVITDLRDMHPGLPLSVDTRKAVVAEAALRTGADIVNDVSGGRDPRMLDLVAEQGAAIVLMHMRGEPQTMQHDTSYDDVVDEVHGWLEERAEAALVAGVSRDRVWLDPGIGFGKDVDGNLSLLAALPRLARLGHPVVVGPSRKSFLGMLTGAGVDARLPGTLAALLPTIGLEKVAIRVHEPRPVRQFVTVAQRVVERMG